MNVSLFILTGLEPLGGACLNSPPPYLVIGRGILLLRTIPPNRSYAEAIRNENFVTTEKRR